MKMLEELKRARKIGAPLIAIETSDQFATVDAITTEMLNRKNFCLVAWDIVRGFQPRSEMGDYWLKDLYSKEAPEKFTGTGGMIESLVAAERLPKFVSGECEGSMLIVLNAADLLSDPQPIQAVANLRNPFKTSRRTLVLLGPDFRLPAALAQDVLIIDEPLPTPEEIGEILDKLFNGNDIDVAAEIRERAIDATRGLNAFSVEQAAALSIDPPAEKGAKPTVNVEALWNRKRRMISQTPGLTMEDPSERFEDMGGCEQAKQFMQRYFAGRRRPKAIVFIDEGEKVFANVGGGPGDSSGVSQDAFGVTLKEMQDQKYSGMVLVGPPGCTKTMFARGVASTFGVPCVSLDLGAAKGSLVGQSEGRVRAAYKAILAMAAQRGAFFAMTCNKLESLPPELRRRFRAGVWFFDLPNGDEREAIAKLQIKKYPEAADALADAPKFFRARSGWSGANIADCCEMVFAMDITLDEAADYIVPAEQQDPAGVARLRAMAHGRFLDASRRGKYTAPAGTQEAAGYGPNVIGVVVAKEQPRVIDFSDSDGRKEEGN